MDRPNRREALGLIAAAVTAGCMDERDSTASETTVDEQSQLTVSVSDCFTSLPRTGGHCYEDLDRDWLGADARTQGESTVRFRLVNQSESTVRVGPSYWTVWQREEDDWRAYVKPARYDIAFDVAPGDSYSWVLVATALGGEPQLPKTDVVQQWGEKENRLPDVPLGPGEYYFGVSSVNRVYEDDALRVLFPLTVTEG
jgi:hypothetical protein